MNANLDISVAKNVVRERYGPNRKVKQDMLGSFVQHGLSQQEAEGEVVLQMWDIVIPCHRGSN
jgi:hypothetical protein